MRLCINFTKYNYFDPTHFVYFILLSSLPFSLLFSYFRACILIFFPYITLATQIAARIKEAELNMMSDERDNYKQQLHSITEVIYRSLIIALSILAQCRACVCCAIDMCIISVAYFIKWYIIIK